MNQWIAVYMVVSGLALPYMAYLLWRGDQAIETANTTIEDLEQKVKIHEADAEAQHALKLEERERREKAEREKDRWEAIAKWVPDRRQLTSVIMQEGLGRNGELRIALAPPRTFDWDKPDTGSLFIHDLTLKAMRVGYMEETMQRVGGEPVAKKPVYGWAIIHPANDTVLAVGFPTRQERTIYYYRLMPADLRQDQLTAFLDKPESWDRF